MKKFIHREKEINEQDEKAKSVKARIVWIYLMLGFCLVLAGSNIIPFRIYQFSIGTFASASCVFQLLWLYGKRTVRKHNTISLAFCVLAVVTYVLQVAFQSH